MRTEIDDSDHHSFIFNYKFYVYTMKMSAGICDILTYFSWFIAAYLGTYTTHL